MTLDDVTYWVDLGLDPTVAFELKDARIGYAHRMEIRDNGYTRFIACVVFEKNRPHALSIFEVPTSLVVRVEPFSPKKGETFGEFLDALKRGLFGRGERDGQQDR